MRLLVSNTTKSWIIQVFIRITKIKINFNGGDLSSDSGMLLIHEFAQKLGLEQLLEQDFSTNDDKTRKHTDSKNAIQKIY